MIRTPLKAVMKRITPIAERPAPEASGAGGKIAGAMGAAYEAAKAGGKHGGMLRIYRALPDHLVAKAIRSLAARAAEHRAWIASPGLKLGAGVPAIEVERLVKVRWPKEVQAFEQEIEVLRGILQERAKR